MFALQFSKYGGPEVLEVADADEPHASSGQVRIAVKASSVNPIDWKIRAGFMGADATFPAFLGFDGAGLVDEVGEGVSGFAVGDHVFGLGSRTAAEFAVLNSFAHKPAQMSWAEAAAAGVGGETAYRGLGLLGTTAGTSVLIDGAAGGVGGFAVQLAVARGASVFASASEGSHSYLTSLGATPVTYGEGLAERVRALAPDGVDGVFDVAGKSPIEDLISLVPEPSQVVSIANFSAPEAGARVTSGSGDGDPVAAFAQVAELFAAGKLQIPVQASYPLTDAATAHRLSQEGHLRGKLVLLMATPEDS